MARIYISSTYKDLQDCRERVYHTLRQLGHDVIAMEDYVAAASRPLDQCLADVAGCDYYIGIFAWRYGFIPEGQTRSITELEYAEASRLEKRRLIFLMKDDAPRMIDQIDEDRRAIKGFRDRLRLERMISEFATADQLAALVSVAINRKIEPSPVDTAKAVGIGSELYLMCDRENQEVTFKGLLRGGSPPALVACAVPGQVQDLPESLVRRLFRTTQKFAEERWGKSEGVCEQYRISWPEPDKYDARSRQSYLLDRVCDLAKIGFTEDPGEFGLLLSSNPEKVKVFQHSIRIGGWLEAGDRELLQWYLDFWKGAAPYLNGSMAILFFNLIIPETKRWPFSGGAKLTERVLEEVKQLLVSQSREFKGSVFRTLECVSYDHVEKWMEEWLTPQVHQRDRERECLRIISARNACQPMGEIEVKLEMFCKQQFNAGGSR
jgi:hypothetical protein